jgi:hypothetical protein
MAEVKARRTLLKSMPELWTECSEPASLARHLGEFGEIRITRLEPESTVAWEGDAVSGTVQLEAAGWGTRVTLAMEDAREARGGETPAAEPQVAEPEPEPAEPVEAVEAVEPVEPIEADEPVEPVEPVEPEPEAAEPQPPSRPGVLARLFAAFRRSPAPEPALELEPAPKPERTLAADPDPAPEPQPQPQPQPAPGPQPAPEAEVEAEAAPSPEPQVAPEDSPNQRALTAALDSLGRAHHRPYSRS